MANQARRPSNLTAAIAMALHRTVQRSAGATYVVLAAAAMAAVCEYIQHATPMDPQLLAALNARDDVFYGHACEHCGHDPSVAEGDAEAFAEACADELIAAHELGAARMLSPLQRSRYHAARRDGRTHAEAVDVAMADATVEAKRATHADLVEAPCRNVEALDRRSLAAGERGDG